MSIEQKIQTGVDISQLTTFKIGGQAEFFIEIKEKNEVEEVFAWAEENKKEVIILGGGSNILASDEGIKALVVKLGNDQALFKGERLECGAAATLNRIYALASSNLFSGLEWSVGIPRATIGGAVLGNAGGFGSYISDIIETVEVFNIKKRRFETFSKNFCDFDYRDSVFKKKGFYLIWSVTLKMPKKSSKEINKEVDKVMQFRKEKQPKLPSAGSVFKNLNINDIRKNNIALADRAIEDGVVKNDYLSAGWIIDLAGLKGKAMGGAKVSLEHANFIVNTGRAKAEDVVMLISYIKQQVRDRFGVQLQEEIRYLGF